MQFIREQSYQAHYQTVDTTRAHLCELIAIRILRRFDEDNPGRGGLLLIAHILISGFGPFQNAPEDVQREHRHSLPWTVQDRGGRERKLCALEVGIVSESKAFLSSPSCQKVVDAIYKGRLVFTPISFIDILPDHYKHKPIALYQPEHEPLLNQYRLIVPRTRNILEISQFIVLLALFILVMETRAHFLQSSEIVFCIYAFGWILDQVASILEHGWRVYTHNLWSFLDVTFAVIFSIYFILRVRGAVTDDPVQSMQAFDILSTAAPFLIPRLAFNLMTENMLFVSLRAMMADFAFLTMLAVWCFGGFLLSMTWLGNGVHHPVTISKWMLWVWFGLDGTGIQRSIDFHKILGPLLMVTFAFLGNTLFLTILVSMLSNTFSGIVQNSNAEIQFRRTVLTFQGVKSDSIFAYQPPFNMLALVILLPVKFIASPRWFHKINVTATRILNAPLLLVINVYERQSLWDTRPSRTRAKPSIWDLSRFSVHEDIQAVFEFEPPSSVLAQATSACPPHLHFASDHDTDHKGKGRGEAQTLRHRAKPRKDSFAQFDGQAPLSELVSHGVHAETHDRLESLANSISTIELSLEKVLDRLDQMGSADPSEDVT